MEQPADLPLRQSKVSRTRPAVESMMNAGNLHQKEGPRLYHARADWECQPAFGIGQVLSRHILQGADTEFVPTEIDIPCGLAYMRD